MPETTPARRYLGALALGDQQLLDDLYAKDAVLHSPLGPFEGSLAIGGHLAELRSAFPGLRVALHDEFYGPDGARGCFRVQLHWHNAGRFRGHEPTGTSGTMTETHSLRLEDGRIVEQIAGASTFQLPRLFLAEWGLDFPREAPDPQPAILVASPGTPAEDPAMPDGLAPTLARRFAAAFGRRDGEALDELYAEEVELYTPLGWPVRGRQAVKEFVDQFHASNPGLRVALHDEFSNADGTRACWRIRLHYHNAAPFYGNPPTGETGVMTETHAVVVQGGRIVQHVVGDNSFHMPYQELVVWKLPFPTENPDPSQVIFSAGGAER